MKTSKLETWLEVQVSQKSKEINFSYVNYSQYSEGGI